MTKHFNKKSLMERRRQLRTKMTDSEQILWKRLRKKQLEVRFLRQYSVDGYILDFYSPEIKLAIEIDGGIHLENEQRNYDIERQEMLEQFGITFLRFSNDEVNNDCGKVVDTVKYNIEKLRNPS